MWVHWFRNCAITLTLHDKLFQSKIASIFQQWPLDIQCRTINLTRPANTNMAAFGIQLSCPLGILNIYSSSNQKFINWQPPLTLFWPAVVMWRSYMGWFRPWPVGIGLRYVETLPILTALFFYSVKDDQLDTVGLQHGGLEDNNFMNLRHNLFIHKDAV